MLECAEPHDRVYGILGLTSLRSRVTVEYARPSQDVFWELVEVLRREDKLWVHTIASYNLETWRHLGRLINVKEEDLENIPASLGA